MINHAPKACPRGDFLIFERFPAKRGLYCYRKQKNLNPETTTYGRVTYGDPLQPEINDESCTDSDSCEEYIDEEINEELHPSYITRP